MPDEHSERAKRRVGALYSWAADRVYDRVVVNGAFKVFGGNLNELVREQGRRALDVAAGRPILDMPVGTAYFATDVARSYEGVVVGVDIAAGMVREAHRVARAAGASLEVVQGDAHALPFADATFGAILCSNGLQVIPGLEPSVRELARVLGDNGTLFVSVITLPAPVPKDMRSHLPTMMRPGEDVTDALEAAGLRARITQKERLATLIEASKP
ncbi:MAG: class I SAM-dependent methyltransferase [Actinomycetota bacterium]|nr:class I SAM-dependent methyltransferase [Actinomycetota bacterium]